MAAISANFFIATPVKRRFPIVPASAAALDPERAVVLALAVGAVALRADRAHVGGAGLDDLELPGGEAGFHVCHDLQRIARPLDGIGGVAALEERLHVRI